MSDEDVAFLQAFDPDTAAPFEWAWMYRLKGLQVLPARMPRPGEPWKIPALPSWKIYETQMTDLDTFNSLFFARSLFNIGTVCGAVSGNLLVLDLDPQKGRGATAWLWNLLITHNNGMDLETWTQQTGGGGLQLFFRLPDGVRAPTGQNAALGIDVRGEGGWDMLPPSLHESGRQYQWVIGLGPWECELLPIPSWLLEAIVEIIVNSKAASKQGASQTNTGRPPAAESTHNAFGMQIEGREQKMAEMVFARVADMRRRSPILPTAAEIEAELLDAYSIYESAVHPRSAATTEGSKGERLEREGRGLTAFREKFYYLIRQWDTKVADAAQEVPVQNVVQLIRNVEPVGQDDPIFDPWEERPPTPPFPMDVLPGKIAAYCRMVATETGGDPSAVAMTVLTYASGAIDKSFRIAMKATPGNFWFEPPRLWVMLVGDPSSMKTPILRAVGRPLAAIERRLQERAAAAKAAWIREGKDAGEPEPPDAPYLTADVTTVQAVAKLMSTHNRGVLIKPDELSGWLTSMDQWNKSAGPDKAFWLKCYNGAEFRSDTIGKGSMFVENLCVSIIGGIQPKSLGRLEDLSADGLMQRFVPVMIEQGRMPADANDAIAHLAWEQMTERLWQLAPANINIDPETSNIFLEFSGFMLEEQKSNIHSDAYKQFCGKLRGLIGSISLILHLMDGVEFNRVSARTALRARLIIEDFIIPHAQIFYKENFGGLSDAVKPFAAYILTSDKARYTGRDFSQNISRARGLGTKEMAQALSPLVNGGWLVEEAVAGRPDARAWTVTPGLRERLAARREELLPGRRAVGEMLRKAREAKISTEPKVVASDATPAAPTLTPPINESDWT